jgi:DNA replication and repair protein RecF
MMLTRLALSNFRSYPDALLQPGPGFVVLTGENGAARPTCWRAFPALAWSRPARGDAGRDGRAGGPGGFAVSVRLGAGTEAVDIGTGTGAASPERRQVRVNGAPASATSLAEWLSVLWLTPAMDRLFLEGASGRRRFLDRLVLALEPAHATHAARYEAAMRARNKLLGDERPDRDWLGALEARMAEHGAAMAAARARTVAALSERLAGAPPGPFARAGLVLGGWTQGDLQLELSSGRARDAAAGRSLAGPHRTDLLVTHLGKQQPAERCSTGEQKALLLGLV